MARLTVVLPALRGFDSVSTALSRWEAQTRRSELELVVLCPDGVDGTNGVRVVDSRGLLLHEARARGIREATADYVLLAEDHCLPSPTWAGEIVPRLDEGWDGLGCTLAPGETRDARSQAAFLVAYGEWMAPLETGPTRVLPGHNVVLRRRLLLDLGDELEELLVVSALLVRRIGRGRRLGIVAEAGMTHYDATGRRHQLAVFWAVGKSFGAFRTCGRSAAGRALYAACFPLVAAAHFRRAVTQYRRAGRANGMRTWCLPPAAVLASAWALGEALGALLGPRHVVRTAWLSETKPVSAERLEPR